MYILPNVHSGVHEVQKWTLDPLKLLLWMVVWQYVVVETETEQ